jgi:hypothetical protein
MRAFGTKPSHLRGLGEIEAAALITRLQRPFHAIRDAAERAGHERLRRGGALCAGAKRSTERDAPPQFDSMPGFGDLDWKLSAILERRKLRRIQDNRNSGGPLQCVAQAKEKDHPSIGTHL